MQRLWIRGWQVIVLLALLLPLAPASVSAQDPLPGVLAGFYQSPTYGFTLTWDESIWAVLRSESNGRTDELTLQSDASDFSVRATPYTMSVQQCVEQAIADVAAINGTLEIIEPAVNGSATVQTLLPDASGVQNRFIRKITCVAPADQAYLVRFIHYAYSERFDALESSALAIRASLQHASPPGDGAQPPRPPLGVLEVTTVIVAGGSPLDGASQFLTVDLFFENVDEDGYDSELDANRIVLANHGPAASFTWLVNDTAISDPIVLVQRGETVVGRFTFVVPSDTQKSTLCYQHQLDNGCSEISTIAYAPGNPEDAGSTTGGGSGSRPRIDPGR